METTWNIKKFPETETFQQHPEIVNKHTVQWQFKKFCNGDERLENEKHSGQPLEVDNNQLRAITEGDPLTTTQEVAEELNIDRSTVV